MTSPEAALPLAGRMVRGGTVTFAGAALTRLVGAATVVVLARHFGIDDFAAFSFGIAFATFFSTLSDFGLDSVIVRELAAATDDRDEVLGSAVMAKALTVAASAVVGVGVAMLYDGDLRSAGLVGSATVLQALASTYGLSLTAELDMAAPTFIRTAALVVASVGAVVAALAGAGPILVLGVQAAIGFLPGLALFGLVRRRRNVRPRLAWNRVSALLRESVPVAAATLAVVVFARVDQLLLGALGSLEDVAAYGVVVRVVDLLNVVLIAVTAVVLPAVSSLSDAEPVRIQRIAIRGNRYLAAVVLPAAALATVVGGPALGFVFGAEFADSGAVLAVLAWAHAFGFVFVLSRQILIGTGRSAELARLAWTAAVVNVVLNVVLIPDHGATGAAVASLIAYGTPVLVTLARGDRLHPFALGVHAIWRAAAAALLMIAMASLSATVAPWGVVAAVAVAVAPVALTITGAVRLDDFREIRAAGSRSTVA